MSAPRSKSWLGRLGTEAYKAPATFEATCRRVIAVVTRSDFWDDLRDGFPTKTHRCGGKKAGETCHIKRWFGTLRAQVGRLVPKADSLSMCAERHLDAIYLFIATHTLRIKQAATLN